MSLRKRIVDSLFPLARSDLGSRYRVIGAYLLLMVYSALICIGIMLFLVQGVLTSISVPFLMQVDYPPSSYSASFPAFLALCMTIGVVGWISAILGAIRLKSVSSATSKLMRMVMLAFIIVAVLVLLIFVFLTNSPGDLEKGLPYILLAFAFMIYAPLIGLVGKGSYYYGVILFQLFLLAPCYFAVFALLEGLIQGLPLMDFRAWLQLFFINYFHVSALLVPTVLTPTIAYISPDLIVDLRNLGARIGGNRGRRTFGAIGAIYVIYGGFFWGFIALLAFPVELFASQFLQSLPLIGAASFVEQSHIQSSILNFLTGFPLTAYAIVTLLSGTAKGSSSQSETKARLLFTAGFMLLLMPGFAQWEVMLVQANLGSLFLSSTPFIFFMVVGDVIAFFAFVYGFKRIYPRLRQPEEPEEILASPEIGQELAWSKQTGLFASLIVATVVAGVILFGFFSVLF